MMLFSTPQLLVSQRKVAAPGGGGSPTLAYIGQTAPTYSTNTASASSVNIGTPAADRLVILAFMDFNLGTVQSGLPTVTIGGVTATVHTLSSLQAGAGGSPDVGIASAVVPTGTTATISVAYASAVGGFGDFEVYTLTGYSSATPTGANSAFNQASGPFSVSSNIATSSGGVIVSMQIINNNSQTTTMAGSTETFSDDINPITVIGSTNGSASHATGIGTNASNLVQADFSPNGTFSRGAIASAAWR